MTTQWQPVADDFDFVVAAATQGQQPQSQTQPQQTPIQQHFNQNAVTGVVPGPEWQVSTEGLPPTQQFIPPQQPPVTTTAPEEQPPVTTTAPEEQPPVTTNAPTPTLEVEQKSEFNLDMEIDNLLKEFGIETNKPIQKPIEEDNQKLSPEKENDNKSIAKDEKINILLEKLATDRDELREKLGLESYEKEQYKLAAEKLQNKLSEVIEQKTALEYDENKIQVNDDIKEFVHFYNKRSKEKDQQTPDSVLTKRTLAEAVKVVEAITNLNLDNYLSQYYLVNHPQFPKIWNTHYSPDQLLNIDPNKPRERTVQEKKDDPNWNPMEDRF